MRSKRRFKAHGAFKSKVLRGTLEEEPFAGLTNLFDLGVVFALGFMLALLSYHSLSELVTKDQEFTMVKNPGKPDMEVVVKKEGKKLESYRVTQKGIAGQGIRLGIAYQLANGDVVYVPETNSAESEETERR